MSDVDYLIGAVTHEYMMCKMLAGLRGLPEPFDGKSLEQVLAPLTEAKRREREGLRAELDAILKEVQQ